MAKRAPIKPSRKMASAFVPISHTVLSKTPTGQEWRKDLLVSWLFQTSIRLQTSMDRRCLNYGLTLQEANVLLHCVETRRVTPGTLSASLGRDKGKITRFIDRLETGGLVTRDIDRRDRRISVLKPTAKGKQVARYLAFVFDTIRKELFAGISENHVRQLSRTLSELYKNATRIGVRTRRDAMQRRRRIGAHGKKTEVAKTSAPQSVADIVTPFAKEHAADAPEFELEGRERWLVGSEHSGDERAVGRQPIEKHQELVLK
jgi:DNA-binding MarR family transcriptional regulator